MGRFWNKSEEERYLGKIILIKYYFIDTIFLIVLTGECPYAKIF